MSYRVTKITSALYRLGGGVRMLDLEDWMRTWADDAMLTGVTAMVERKKGGTELPLRWSYNV